MTKISWYKRLWRFLGKRPWTFIYRDLWHKFEWFAQMQWLVTGFSICVLGYWIGEKIHATPWHIALIALGIFITIYTYGYINGHFFWGKKYIPGQIGDLKRADEVWKCEFCGLLGTYAEVMAHIKAKHYGRKKYPIRRLEEA